MRREVPSSQGGSYRRFHGFIGVGKTAEGIGRDLALREQFGSHLRTLIICTKNGIAVWKRHLLELGVEESHILAINPRDRSVFEKELGKGAKGYRYYICHWDVLTRLEDLNSGRNSIVWDHVIADEAHMAKNRQAARTRELKKIKCVAKTALTGTPADNKPHDLWSILNWLYPKHYTSYWRFFNTHIEWNDFSGFRQITGVKNLDKLHAEIAPFYIRRTLHDVRDDMPEKTYEEIFVDLTPKQRKTYNNMRDQQIAYLGGDDEPLVAPVAIAVLQRLQKLALGTCRVDWTEEDWNTYRKDMLRYEEELNDWNHSDPNDRGSKPKRPKGPPIIVEEPSPKLDVLMDLFETHDEEPFVVFTQFSDMADLIEAKCRSKGIPVSKITGSVVSESARAKSVSDFQSGVTRVFVGTIGAAGTTITLNRAHTAIFVDRDWNPSKNDQAEDRIFRIDNDTQPIHIIDLITRDTVDQERLITIGQKKKWLKDFISPRAIIR